MAKINILDTNTIDKIAAGEVVERPMSVVKELVENAIDAGATIITVEIKNGGIKLIRVTDNGSGIEADQIRNAFYPHATSKINDAEDLNHLNTLGFRGEALSSIAAVSRVEVTSRTLDSITGIHYCIEGGKEEKLEEVGAPAGTTFVVRDIFYNTLPRLKFLKSETSEGNLIADLMEHLALSMPHISFSFISNGNTKFSTSGRGDLAEVIYRIFGRDTAEHLRAVDFSDEELAMRVHGYLGLPSINRSNRSSEIFFINHRYIKSSMISKAVEEGYVEYLMQHKFPFCVLNMEFDPYNIDVNVHPTKTEVRISNEIDVYNSIVKGISETLISKEMIDNCVLEDKKDSDTKPKTTQRLPENFEINRLTNISANTNNEIINSDNIVTHKNLISVVDNQSTEDTSNEDQSDFFVDNTAKVTTVERESSTIEEISPIVELNKTESDDIKEADDLNKSDNNKFEQLSIFEEERLFSEQARRKYRIIGQLFKTYWLIEYEGSLLIMDQHAAHEKVRFERLMKFVNNKQDIPSQLVSPAEIISVSNREKQVIFDNIERFNELGFTLDEFGDHEVAIRSVPLDLYGSSASEMVSEILNDLLEMKRSETPDSIRSRIATMACKAAIKGNNYVSEKEIQVLLDEMLTLDNPYNCPHGRPTMISMTETELEKRFHRIV